MSKKQIEYIVSDANQDPKVLEEYIDSVPCFGFFLETEKECSTCEIKFGCAKARNGVLSTIARKKDLEYTKDIAISALEEQKERIAKKRDEFKAKIPSRPKISDWT